MDNELISMSELAKELGMNKSKLCYYTRYGLLVPVKKLDSTTIFDKKRAISTLEKIEAKSEQGFTLENIKKMLLNKTL